MTSMRQGGPSPSAGAWDTELRHGYTLADIHKLTMIAVLKDYWHRDMSLDERQDLAWSAIAECLYGHDGSPTRHELIHAAQTAIGEQWRTDRGSHGIPYQKLGTSKDMPNFWRYWWTCTGPTHGPEERVVDRLALHQIWTELSPRSRAVLLALATHDDHNLAAESLGIARPVYNHWLSQARNSFYALWHEGEQPSRIWAPDHRHGNGSHSVTNNIRRRARARRAREAALAASGAA
jgi:hypothetical protein